MKHLTYTSHICEYLISAMYRYNSNIDTCSYLSPAALAYDAGKPVQAFWRFPCIVMVHSRAVVAQCESRVVSRESVANVGRHIGHVVVYLAIVCDHRSTIIV